MKKIFESYYEYKYSKDNFNEELDTILEQYDMLDEGAISAFLKTVAERVGKILSKSKDTAAAIVKNAAKRADDLIKTKGPAAKEAANKIILQAKEKSAYVIENGKKSATRLKEAATKRVDREKLKATIKAAKDKATNTI